MELTFLPFNGYIVQWQYFTLPGLFHVESMEWGVDSMEWWMDSMEWWMDSIVLVDGFHGMVDGFHTFADGFHTFFRWIPWSFQMDSIWTKFMEL